MCSTPEGIEAGSRYRTAWLTSSSWRAQRPKASKRDRVCFWRPAIRLRAPRAQRPKASKRDRGLNERLQTVQRCAQRPKASKRDRVRVGGRTRLNPRCSTPEGIEAGSSGCQMHKQLALRRVLNARRHRSGIEHDSHHASPRASWCSTPEGIEAGSSPDKARASERRS